MHFFQCCMAAHNLRFGLWLYLMRLSASTAAIAALLSRGKEEYDGGRSRHTAGAGLAAADRPLQQVSVSSDVQLYKQHFASEGGDDDEEDGDGLDGEGIADLAPSVNKKRLVRLQAAEHFPCDARRHAHHSDVRGASARCRQEIQEIGQVDWPNSFS